MPEPTLRELAAPLLKKCPAGTLSTWSLRQPGFPFGSMVQYAVDAQGRPIFLLSGLAVHTKNLLADPRASLTVAEATPAGQELVAARMTVIGEMKQVPEEEVRTLYLDRHPDAAEWVDFGDFRFWRLEVLDTYFVGGFGVMGWIV